MLKQKGNNAWVVMVTGDNMVKSGLLSGHMIRKSGTTMQIVALVSTEVSMESINELNTVFDMVVVKKALNEIDQEELKGAFMLNALTLATFSKLVVIQAGVIPQKGQDDNLFETNETNKLILVDETETHLMALVTPDILKFGEIMETIKLEFKARAKVLDLIFGNNRAAKGESEIKYVTEEKAAKRCIEEMDMMMRENLFSVDKSKWVAIVGMSCRFPQANSVDEYWELLANGKNTCGTVPPHRIPLVDLDPNLKGNFLKCPVDQFDASFFGFSPMEASFTDPQARLLLEVSWEALEDAGVNPDDIRGAKVGVFHGSWLQEYKEAMNENCSTPSQDFVRKYLGNSIGSTGAKLSFFYGTTGPNIATDSACSSSMVAIDLACKSLARKQCKLALACGANLMLQTNKNFVFCAEDGKSKTFDAGANGYARGEGIAVLVLKRYLDAISENDNIHGIIRGIGSSQEGLSKSFGAPTVESEYMSMREALVAAKVDPTQVDYIEAHATGTAVGDPIEAAAIVKAYDSGSIIRDSPLIIGSGKTNLGHTESCSGMAGIIKVLLSMKHKLIPKHLNLTKLNPQVDFTPIPGYIPLEPNPWPRKLNGRPRIAGVSSFGITGTDVHIILQEPPMKEKRQIENSSFSPTQILTLSAKSDIALEQMTNKFLTYLETSENEHSIQDITYTANVCRSHLPIRRAILGSSVTDLVRNIQNGCNIYTSIHPTPSTSTAKKICFSFPGRIGIMPLQPILQLYQTISYFKDVMDSCDQIFKQVYSNSGSLIEILIKHAVEHENTPKGAEWYALLVACHISLTKIWNNWGIFPSLVVGHCFGEFSAAVVCGALTLKDAFEMLKTIPYFLESQAIQPASMVAVNSSQESTEDLIQNFLLDNKADKSSTWIDVASVNSTFQTVVVGPPVTILAFQEYCVERQIKYKIVPGDFCAHSRAVETASQKSLNIFNKIVHQPIKIPYVSSSTGGLVKDSELNGMFWFKVIRNCVYFKQACLSAMDTQLADIFLEIGLDTSLTNFTRANLQNNQTCLASFPRKEYGIHDTLAEMYTLGVNINWNNYHGSGRRNKVRLPHYPFQRKSFWYERKTRSFSHIPLNYSTRVEIHPFLGSDTEIPPAVGFAYFRNDNFLCEDQQTKFVHDHVIGDKVIFPGSGFLEMIMSAWKQAMKLHNISLYSVEKFAIHEALLLEKSKTVSIVTAVNKDNGNVSIHTTNGTGQQWRLHATAEIILGKSKEYSINSIINTISHNDESEKRASEFYVNLSKVGLNFGPDFKSLKHVYVTKNGDTVAEVQTLSQSSDCFSCHPILIDAMIQGYMVHTKPNMTKLHVPVKMSKFDLVSPSCLLENGKYFVHCQNGSTTVSLLDQNGQVVALMRSPELVATTTEKVHAAAAVNKYEKSLVPTNSMSIYDVYWKEAKCYQPSALFREIIEMYTNNLEYEIELSDFQRRQTILNALSEEEVHFDETMNQLCYLYVVKALFDIGCVQELGGTVFGGVHSNAEQKWGIVPGLVKAFRHFVSYVNGNEELIKKTSLERVEHEIESILALPEIKGYAAMKTIHECGWNLAGILKGSVNPHKILFGERNLAEHFYRTTRLLVKTQETQDNLFTLIASKWKASLKSRQQTLKILEIGAGTGVFPKRVIPVLRKMGVKFHYHFTDISRTLVSRAKETFEADSEDFTFKVLNIEMDPLKQGFPPGYFDIVIAVDVLHATRNLNDTLRNIQMVTNFGGVLLMEETEKPIREADICFGGFDGYWLFEDNIRKNHCTISSETWLRILAENGFSGNPCRVLSSGGQCSVISACKTDKNQSYPIRSGEWAVFELERGAFSEYKSRMESVTNRNYNVFLLHSKMGAAQLQEYINNSLGGDLEGVLLWMCRPTSMSCDPLAREILEPLLYISKYLQQVKGKAPPKFHLVTGDCWDLPPPMNLAEINSQGPSLAEAWGFMRSARVELTGILSKSIDLEMSGAIDEIVTQVTTEMWLDDKETEVVYRKGTRYVSRLKEQTNKLENIHIPDAEMFQVELPKSKALSDIKFTETCGVEELKENQVRIEVRSVALNFRDVFAVLKPSWNFEKMNSIGLDYSGVVTEVGTNVAKWKVGDAVFGLSCDEGCLRSHLITNDNLLMAIPTSMTFAEVSTLPTVFATAWYCMVNVANLQPGQTMLLHAASGGVGLAAIQIAKVLGVRVIGTAGSEKKRRFLRRLGVELVFDSRTLDFKSEITKITGGKGVDMVLNCLTGPGFKESSLAVCRDGGHFVEISKLDIWSESEVRDMRPQVNYAIVDLAQLEKSEIEPILGKLSELLVEGTIQSIHHKAYPAHYLNHALAYLQKAKHIGKVVINMPISHFGERKSCIFNDRSTYLITAGKSGIGFQVCKWMVVEHGAKYFVLVSRSPAKENVKQAIAELENDFGAKIVCKEVDVSDFSQCKALIEKDLKDLPPLRGVHHCAAILSDQLISTQDWSNFEKVISPKALGAWNLHQLTLETPLEHFVLYSSAISVFGNVGQANYSCANAYMDNLATLRTSMGLPVLSVNWGQWNAGLAENMEITSFKPFSIEEGIQTLYYFMQINNDQQNRIVAAKIIFDGLLKLSPWFKNSLLEDIVISSSVTGQGDVSSPGKADKVSLATQLKELANDEHAKDKVVRSFILQMLCDTLGTSKDEIKDDVMFADMGMDSLMSIEFTNKMHSALEENMNEGDGEFSIQLDLDENGTLDKLTKFVLYAFEQVE